MVDYIPDFNDVGRGESSRARGRGWTIVVIGVVRVSKAITLEIGDEV